MDRLRIRVTAAWMRFGIGTVDGPTSFLACRLTLGSLAEQAVKHDLALACAWYTLSLLVRQTRTERSRANTVEVPEGRLHAAARYALLTRNSRSTLW